MAIDGLPNADAMLARVRERVVEQCEESPLGRLLEEAMPVVPLADSAAAWPQSLLTSDLSERLVSPVDTVPSPRDWGAVRIAVLDDIAGRTARRALRRRVIGSTGVAAVLMASLLLLRETGSPVSLPEVRIADIDQPPDMDPWLSSPISVLRTGGPK
ncbi:MAG: hypothetical protein KDC98_24735 [Planctomycetes bacterium]|nr:hypothetical protein [Planctomycetota bacterium]